MKISAATNALIVSTSCFILASRQGVICALLTRVLGVELGASSPEELDDFEPALAAGEVQAADLLLVDSTQIGASVQQSLDLREACCSRLLLGGQAAFNAVKEVLQSDRVFIDRYRMRVIMPLTSSA